MTEEEAQFIRAGLQYALDHQKLEIALKKGGQAVVQAQKRRAVSQGVMGVRASDLLKKPSEAWSVQPDTDFIHRS